MYSWKRNKAAGFSLASLVVAIGIFGILMGGFAYFLTGSQLPFIGSANDRERERFAREAIEALESIKGYSWTTIATNDNGDSANRTNSVKVTKNSATKLWEMSSGTETRDAFTREIYISAVQRDTNGAIVASGGSDDPATKKVVVLVTATGRANLSVEEYLTNWEAYRMTQTGWSGSASTQIWTAGTGDYFSATNMDVPTTQGKLELSGS